MTARDKLDANEQREALFAAVGWSCVVCKRPLAIEGTPQLAHRVAKTKARLNTYGSDVLNHTLNLVPVCCLAHNDACNIGNRPMEAQALLQRIIRVNTGAEEQPDMRSEYRALRKAFEEQRRQH